MIDVENLISVGKITKNQGNKGEVRVIPLTDFPDRFELLKRVFLVKGSEIEEKIIESTRQHKKFVVIKFSGIDSIEQAVKLRDYEIKIPEEELLPLAEDQYYIYRIIGSSVYTTKGEKLGQLTEVQPTGGTDIFVVKGAEKNYLIPASLEIVVDIDEENNKIVIDPIPGLLDL